MAKPVLGSKRVCVACQARFYDLTRAPAVCPKCGTEQPLEQPRPRRSGGGNVVEDKRVKKPVPEPGIEEVEVEGVEDSEDDDDVLEDATDLEDDADAISTDIEVETDRDEVER